MVSVESVRLETAPTGVVERVYFGSLVSIKHLARDHLVQSRTYAPTGNRDLEIAPTLRSISETHSLSVRLMVQEQGLNCSTTIQHSQNRLINYEQYLLSKHLTQIRNTIKNPCRRCSRAFQLIRLELPGPNQNAPHSHSFRAQDVGCDIIANHNHFAR